MDKIQPGSIILFKGKGFLFQVLSRIIQLKYPWWDRWGWHMALTVGYFSEYGWMVAEATGIGVEYSSIDDKKQPYRVINWCDDDISDHRVLTYVDSRLLCKYDKWAYIWTALQVLFPWVPRIVNRRYTCWEFVYEFCREMGHAVQQPHKYPMITDILKGESDASDLSV